MTAGASGAECLCGAPNIPQMGRSRMSTMPSSLRRLAFAAVLAFAPCAGLAQPADTGADLSEATLYDLLVGEIALQRGDATLASKIYLELARSTRDPRVARHAVEVANVARQPDLALEAAKIWQEAAPTSPQPLQVIAAI